VKGYTRYEKYAIFYSDTIRYTNPSMTRVSATIFLVWYMICMSSWYGWYCYMVDCCDLLKLDRYWRWCICHTNCVFK